MTLAPGSVSSALLQEPTEDSAEAVRSRGARSRRLKAAWSPQLPQRAAGVPASVSELRKATIESRVCFEER